MARTDVTAVEGWMAEHAALPLRASLGSTMLYHGVSKLKGEGLEQTTQFFENIGIKPGRPWVLATAWTEVLAGVSTVLGIGTRAAALAILVTQGVAIAKVHGPKGFDILKGGYEFNLSLIAAALGLLLGGPGRRSLHHSLASRRSSGWSLGCQKASPLARLTTLLG